MSSRWKKVWADFWGNKARTLLTILTIMVGTFGIGFISNLQFYMIESMDSDYLSTSPSEAKIDAYPMNDDTVRIVREMRGVDAVEGRSRAGGQILHVDGEKIPIQITAIEDPGDMLVDRLQPVRNGPGIPSLGYRELLVDVSAASLGYKPGDLITVELNNGKQRKLRLAGYIHDATGVSYSRARYVTAFVTPKTIEWLGGSLNYDMLAVSVAENPTDFDHVTQVAQTIKKRLEQSGLTVSSIAIFQPPGHHYAYKLSQAIFLVMSILGWLTVLLSCFLVLNTITALMSQQTRQIGLMKATGADTLQIFGMYIVLILSFGVIALLVAVPLAGNVAQRIGNGMAAFMGFYTSSYRAYPATLLQQITIALVLPLLAALWPVYNSVRQTVRQTLTDYGIGGSEKFRKTAVRRSNLILPRPIRLSLRNAFRRKARLILTLFTLVLGGAIFISVINLRGSFYRLIDELRGYYLTDVDISFARSYRFDKVADMAKNVPGVESLEGWLRYTGSLVREDSKVESPLMFDAPPSNSILIQPILTSGRWLKPGDENAIVVNNYLLNKYPDLKVGDLLTIKIDGKETSWRIVGTVSTTATIDNPLVYVTYEYLSRLTNQPGQVQSLRVITDRHDLKTQQMVGDRLETIYARNGIRVSGISLGEVNVQSVASLFDIFIYFFLVMAVLIAVIGAMGLTSTMSINVMERTREIGVIRAIGASNGNVQSIVIVEGIVIGLISWVISILLSIPITNVMAVGVGMQMFNKPMTIVYGWGGILAWLVGILVIAILASALPARSASRLTIKDILAYEG